MKITETFEVGRDIDRVWEAFENVPDLAQCLPGAELTDDHGDGRYSGQVEAKLGPITARFEGKATVESDSVTHTGSLTGKGVDRRGGSRAQLEVEYGLEAIDGGTRVTVDANVTLSGAAAQFGRIGLLKEMTGRIISEFVECLEAKLGAPTAQTAAAIHAPEVKGMSLLFSSMFAPLVRFIKKLLRRQ
jgi:carbon monoxide dehydrogenase subunit G